MPAAVIVPVRLAPLAFAATVYPTVPLPAPDAGGVIVIHVVLLVAVQGQPVPEVTLNVPLPPVFVNDLEVALMEYVQALSCVIENVLPATVIVPVRVLVPVFAATV